MRGAKLALVRPELTVEVEVACWVELLQLGQGFIVTCSHRFRADNFVGLPQIPCFSTFLSIDILLRVAAGKIFSGMLFAFLTELECDFHCRRPQLLPFALTEFVDCSLNLRGTHAVREDAM